MSSGTAYNPTQAVKWINEVWAKTLDRQAYERAKVYANFEDYERIGNKLHIPFLNNLTPTAATDSTDLYEPTFSSNTESEATVTPQAIYLNVALDWRTLERMAFDPKGQLREAVIMSMAQKIDQDGATKFASLTTNPLGSYATDLDLATILAAKSAVMAGAKEYADPGNFIFVYHALQDDAVMGISALTQWTARGKTDSGANTGMIGEAYGIRFIGSNNIVNSGGGFNNALWVKRAFAVGFNIRPKVAVQEHGAAFWFIGLADYGFATVRDAYAALLKSKTT